MEYSICYYHFQDQMMSPTPPPTFCIDADETKWEHNDMLHVDHFFKFLCFHPYASEVSERASEVPQPLTHSAVVILRALRPEPFTYLDDFPRPDPNHDETILAIPRSASDKNISTKERRARRLWSIVFEQEDGQHSGKKHLIYPPSPFVAKSVAREDGIRECATTVRAANSNVLSGIGFSRPVFHHDGSWLVAYFTDAFDLAGSKGGGGSGNISALLTGVPRDVNKQLLHVTSGMTFSSKTIGGNLNSKVKSAVMKGSTLMKPTASLLAKQNQPHPIVSSR
ncbi:hypothetical protein GmHk_20G057133 [Glycine max]|nr:hypothetical protein GmHk_20G057133 [Glycine max]